MAHHGILFVDEFAEFPRHILEMIRQPLENSRITISRAKRSITFPAQFVLPAAPNPRPCGYFRSGSIRRNVHPARLNDTSQKYLAVGRYN